MITLDGSHGEGGGALVRVALALATLTGQELHITNIRANRESPGLKAQHLAGIETLKNWCKSTTNDIQLGSTELHYKPGSISKGIFHCDIGTAGSITLLLQTLLPPALFAPGKVTFKIKGGTCGKGQASVDYFQHVLLPYLERFAAIEFKILKRGYYPTGGGEVHITITPPHSYQTSKQDKSWNNIIQTLQTSIPPFNLNEADDLLYIKGVINCSQVLAEKEVAERIRRAAQMSLQSFNVPINIAVEYASTTSIGGEIFLYALRGKNNTYNTKNPQIIAASGLLEKSISSEELGKKVAHQLKNNLTSNATVDEHLCDQLILYAGLLPGSQLHPTTINNHTLSNIAVVERFLPVRFEKRGDVLLSHPFSAQDL